MGLNTHANTLSPNIFYYLKSMDTHLRVRPICRPTTPGNNNGMNHEP